MSTTILAKGHVKYKCTSCGKEWLVYVEDGVEVIPMYFNCRKCSGLVRKSTPLITYRTLMNKQAMLISYISKDDNGLFSVRHIR